ncbi:MAG TPA: response regulator [Pyrinomonadaceae bacterium]|jgi:two-component system response regulator|nr:response regulator [Pyrinomonadaceae bacterium]
MNDGTDPSEVTILLVEDSAEDAQLTLRALRKHNLANRVFHVKDGAEALDFIFAKGAYAGRDAENVPKVIFLDLKLPKVDGLQVLKQIRSDDEPREVPIKNVPVVILTSSKEERDIVESYKLGVNSYIVKPVEFDKFVQAVSDLGLYWLLLNQPPR